MPFFNQEKRDKYPKHQQEVLLIDRLVDEVNKVLLEKTTDLYKIKSALFDIVILINLLKKIGIKFELKGAIKDIRDSIAHVDERLNVFNFKPTTIKSEEWAYEEGGGKFKLSKSYNFQGAISMAKVGTDGTVQALGAYGLIDDNFIWIDREGNQQHTSLEQIRNSYSQLIDSAVSAT